jgi:hypothetical protein
VAIRYVIGRVPGIRGGAIGAEVRGRPLTAAVVGTACVLLPMLLLQSLRSSAIRRVVAEGRRPPGACNPPLRRADVRMLAAYEFTMLAEWCLVFLLSLVAVASRTLKRSQRMPLDPFPTFRDCSSLLFPDDAPLRSFPAAFRSGSCRIRFQVGVKNQSRRRRAEGRHEIKCWNFHWID